MRYILITFYENDYCYTADDVNSCFDKLSGSNVFYNIVVNIIDSIISIAIIMENDEIEFSRLGFNKINEINREIDKAIDDNLIIRPIYQTNNCYDKNFSFIEQKLKK